MMRQSGRRSESGHRLDGILGRGQADAGEAVLDQAFQTFERKARCDPRLLPTTAWISSTITVRTVFSIRRPPSLVSRI